MVFENNFAPVGQSGRTIVDLNLKVWVNITRVNQDTAAYELNAEYDPLLEPDHLWVSRSEEDVRISPGSGAYAKLRKFKSDQLTDFLGFGYAFPLKWKDDFNLRLGHTTDGSLFDTQIRSIRNSSVPIASSYPYEFFLYVLRSTLLMNFEKNCNIPPRLISILVSHEIAGKLAKETGETFVPFDDEYVIIAKRDGHSSAFGGIS